MIDMNFVELVADFTRMKIDSGDYKKMSLYKIFPETKQEYKDMSATSKKCSLKLNRGNVPTKPGYYIVGTKEDNKYYVTICHVKAKNDILFASNSDNMLAYIKLEDYNRDEYLWSDELNFSCD